jgi:hypothetical protein
VAHDAIALFAMTGRGWNGIRANGGLALLVLLTAAAGAGPAFAYRPFDSTDPAVADPGEVEVELSPVSFRHDNGGQTWISPQLRLNYGFAQNWEVVLEGQGEHPQSGGSSSALLDNALSLKYVAREGSLQEKTGPSLATELGLLLPGLNGESGTGLALAGIAGQKWDWGAIHFNAAVSLTRERRGELFFGTILEGPGDWTVRPVAEFVYERELGVTETFAALAGVIWQAKDHLAFDLALRQASVNGQPETEVRMGLTFDFSLR